MAPSIAERQELSTDKAESPPLPASVDAWQAVYVPVTFGERLSLAMERKHLDQKATAKLAGLSESAVSRHLERGEAPRPDSIDKYRSALEVNADWLAYGRGDMVPANMPLPEPPIAAAAPAKGIDALERVLDDYDWPDDVDLGSIDAIISEARREAATLPGQQRPRSVWRVYLERVLRVRPRRSGPRPRTG
jgi:transcriptional regulator with XRE-family HTH domain